CARGRQGPGVQQRPHAGTRARLPPRPRGVHGRRGPCAQGEPRRARASVRLPGARRRELPPPHARDLGGCRAEARLEARDDDEVEAAGADLLMQVALKIWRYDPVKGERALREYEFDAPEWATLLDCLDIVKDKIDGTLGYRKSCRMMICGSCGMRMN